MTSLLLKEDHSHSGKNYSSWIKTVIYCAFFSWICFVFTSVAGTETNHVCQFDPKEIEAARSPVWDKQPTLGRIGTNTPAFENYSLTLMLAAANRFREAADLDCKKLELQDVYFWCLAHKDGVDGVLSTRSTNLSLSWGFGNNMLGCFRDFHYSKMFFLYNDDEEARLAKIKSKIDAKQAEEIAQNFLKKYNIIPKEQGLVEKPEVHQYKFEESNGVVYPLPCFNLTWSNLTDDTYSLSINVSGINNRVVDYFYLGKSFNIPVPTNYLDMLGVLPPTNNIQRAGLAPYPKK